MQTATLARRVSEDVSTKTSLTRRASVGLSHLQETLTMFRICIAVLAAVALTSAASAQDYYGSIADLKLAKPEDAKDTPSVPAPSGAVVLFDGKSLDGWTKRDGKAPAHWKLMDG